jgi:DNA primase
MAAMLSQAVREQVRAASDIVEVVQSYVPLKRAGANWVGLCPFHKEKSPSFNVNSQRQIFHCFGCHKGGDVFRFVQDYENIGFMDAVRRLADRAGIVLKFEAGGEEDQTRHLKDQLLEVHDQITRRWQAALANDAAGQIARDYLAKRGVADEAVKLFRLGYAPDLWDDTVNWAKRQGHPLALVEQAGLVIRKEQTDRYYDRFRGRLMFPIGDELGRVVGFSGRILAGDEKTAKYVNSPETPLFRKSKLFFGLDKSRKALGEAGFAIVCEGQLDLIACFMAGVQNIVAPQGTALTADHTRILKRYTNEVVLCFDSDEAGQNAAVRSLDSLLASGLAVRVAVVPAPHDPDSLIKERGGDAFRQVIEQAEGFFDYYLNRLCRLHDTTTDRGRLEVLREMAETVHKAGNTVLTDTYAQKTALRLGVAPDAVRVEFKRAGLRQPAAAMEVDDEIAESRVTQPPSAQEYWLLRLLFADDQVARTLAVMLDRDWLQHPLVRQLVGLRLDLEVDDSWHGMAEFLESCQDEALRQLATEVATFDRALPNPEQQLRDVVKTLRDQALDRAMRELARQVEQPGIGDDERLALARRGYELRLQKLQPLSGGPAPAQGPGSAPPH